ncbi:hypothetical protein F4820DRAFT_405590 [Hypoxylon rubiginosum]|uniref:Uncharacterized protein n=1 Tax=Hypoxylon rubiginosum TaxID=110542 RepID=A0ACB9ZDJ0_9PEZI|nr:hypothetical protein F4820DRAFT_405590 [Hypoxylon rubiginosum]
MVLCTTCHSSSSLCSGILPRYSGIGLLPMMFGLLVSNPTATFVISKKGVSPVNAIAGAGLEILACGLETRWNAGTSQAEAVLVLLVLNIVQGAAMECF